MEHFSKNQIKPVLSPYKVFWYCAYGKDKPFNSAEVKKAIRLGARVSWDKSVILFVSKVEFIRFITQVDCNATKFTDKQLQLANRKQWALCRTLGYRDASGVPKYIPITRKQLMMTKSDFIPHI